jgi:hypothetical protein
VVFLYKVQVVNKSKMHTGTDLEHLGAIMTSSEVWIVYFRQYNFQITFTADPGLAIHGWNEYILVDQ